MQIGGSSTTAPRAEGPAAPAPAPAEGPAAGAAGAAAGAAAEGAEAAAEGAEAAAEGAAEGAEAAAEGAEAAAEAANNMSPEEADKVTKSTDGMKNFLKDAAEKAADQDPEEGNKLMELLNFMIKCLLYPLLFIFLIIFPYVYVTYSSFTKLLKSYRNNVLTI